MKYLKIGLFLIIGLLVGTVIFSIFLPAEYSHKKSYTLPCELSRVYPRAASFKDWMTWNAWSRFSDSSTTHTIPGNESGKNAVLILESSQWGKALIKVTEDIPMRYLKHEYIFNDGERIIYSTMKFKDSGNQTVVEWTLDWNVKRDPLEKLWAWLSAGRVEKKMDWSIAGLERDCSQSPL